MKCVETIGAVLGLASLAYGHMEMKDPAPFKSKFNTKAGSNVDFDMTSPLDPSGNNFPCKGYHSLFGTPEGASVATWAPGSDQKFSITGGANHGGGSCQASLSYDKGSTWKVIHSFIGNCPGAGETSFAFKVPTDAPSGEAIFAWSWFNKIGNREMYMNCAAVTIGGSNSGSLSSRPDMFVANVGNGATTSEGTDVDFPNPGPDVTKDSAGTSPPGGSGNVAPKPQPGNGSGNNGDNQAPSSGFVTQTAPPAAEPTKVPGGVFITKPPTAPVATPTGGAGNDAPSPKPEEPAAPTPTTAPAAPPAAPPTAPPAAPPAGGEDGGSSTAAGTPCTQDGQWNCVDGTKFQRCASGKWSVAMSMAAGTGCKTGLSANLISIKKRGAGTRRRFVPDTVY